MSTDWTSLQSKTIDTLRFPMAVAVVMLHYSLSVFKGATGALHVLCLLFHEGVCLLAVPSFFFISGFLFFNGLQHWTWAGWGQKLKRRLQSLLLPYLLWNLIALLAFWAYNRLQGSPVGLYEYFQTNGGLGVFWNVHGGLPIGPQSGPIDGPLWFIRDLMYFVLAAPAVYLFIKWTKAYGVLGICVLYLTIPGSVPSGFVFFVMGAYLQLSGKNLLQFFRPARLWLYGLFIPLLVLCCISHGFPEYWNRFCRFFFLVGGIGTVFCLLASYLEKRPDYQVCPFLAKSSFFVFALHEILVLRKIATPAVRAIIPADTALGGIVAFFLVPALAVGICLGFLYILQRFLPRTAVLLTGNRSTKPV